jgi:hypothetical protein
MAVVINDLPAWEVVPTTMMAFMQGTQFWMKVYENGRRAILSG